MGQYCIGTDTVRLYHVFWNVAGSGNASTNHGAYTLELHHPPAGTIGFLYNGRHDVVSKLMQTLVAEMREGKETNFPLSPAGVCRLAHFVLRAASELTKEVAPTFLVHVLGRNRRCTTVEVHPELPSTDLVFAQALQAAGL